MYAVQVVRMDIAAQRELAIRLFNQTWTLLEKSGRTVDEEFLMVHTAHASLFHWLQVGTPLNEARGQWLISRVYATLKWPEPALTHGQRSLQICLDQKIEDFDLAFGYEAVARAYALSGNRDETRKYWGKAREAAKNIQETEDSEYFLKELGTIEIDKT